MPSARIWVKKQIEIKHLNVSQEAMFKIGTVGVASVKNRVGQSKGISDGPAKPLTKRYAIFKTKRGKGNRRNLSLTGQMLNNFQVRTVTENKAKASNSTRKDRIKGWINNKIDEWCGFSPVNKTAVEVATKRVVADLAPRLTIQKFLSQK